MYFSQLRLARDDIRTSGVHVRTLVAAVQVGMLAVILSMQAVLSFIVGVVKRDNLAFALLAPGASLWRGRGGYSGRKRIAGPVSARGQEELFVHPTQTQGCR